MANSGFSIAHLVTYLIVGAAAFYWVRRFYFRFGAGLLANFLLKRGNVKWAMKIRKSAPAGKCGGDCACD